jgi:glutamyl-tRNA reductase
MAIIAGQVEKRYAYWHKNGLMENSLNQVIKLALFLNKYCI